MRIFLLHYYLKKSNPAYTEIAAALRMRGHEVWIGAPDANFDLVWSDGKNETGHIAGPENRRGHSNWRPIQVQNVAFIGRIRSVLANASA